MKLHFLRHGQSEANRDGLYGGLFDTPLTEKGRHQAEAAVDEVIKLDPDVIYCSPLKRAHDTATIIADGADLGHLMVVNDQLVERNVGVMEGEPRQGDKLVSTMPDDVEGVETEEELRNRAVSVIALLESKHDDQIVLVVGHGAFTKMMISVVSGREWAKVQNTIIPNAKVFSAEGEIPSDPQAF